MVSGPAALCSYLRIRSILLKLLHTKLLLDRGPSPWNFWMDSMKTKDQHAPEYLMWISEGRNHGFFPSFLAYGEKGS